MTIFKHAALKAKKQLEFMSKSIAETKKELDLAEFQQTYTKNKVATFSELSKAKVDKAILEMEAAGHVFNKKLQGSVSVYDLTLDDVHQIYQHRGVPKYRDKFTEAFCLFVANLKGGVGKSVLTVNLAQGLRVAPDLLKEDLRILVIDLDPQGSATMFLDHMATIQNLDYTATQLALNDFTTEEIMKDFVRSTNVPGVSIIPSNINDAFVAGEWSNILESDEDLKKFTPHELIQKNIVEKLKYEFDFILIDTGPHMDKVLTNALYASDMIITPIPPAQVDLHSTLRFIERLPSIAAQIEQESGALKCRSHIGVMSKFQSSKREHKQAQRIATSIFDEVLHESLIRSEAFEKVGGTYDTVITQQAKSYDGSSDSLKKAEAVIHELSYDLFAAINSTREV